MSKHKKTNSPLIAGLISAAMVAGLALFAPAASATTVALPSEGLEFIAPTTVLAAGEAGDFYVYENVNGAVNEVDQISAKITILGTTNSQATLVTKIALVPWFAEFWTYINESFVLDDMGKNADGKNVNIKKVFPRYSIDGGETWTSHTTLDFDVVNQEFDWSVRNALVEAWTELTLPEPTDTDNLIVEHRYEWAFCELIETVVDDVTTYTEECDPSSDWPSASTYAATDFSTSFDELDVVTENAVHKVDRITTNSTSDKHIRTNFESINSDLELTIEYKVEFFDSNDLPVTFATLALNAYDVDIAQWVEFQNLDSYLLTDDTIIETVTPIGGDDTHLRFTAADVSASSDPDPGQAHSYGEARVQANFVNVNTVYFSLGFTGSSGSQAFDFTAGYNWEVYGGEIDPPVSSAYSAEPVATESQPVVSVIKVNPTKVTLDKEIITIFGANLHTVNAIYIGGIRVPIFTQSGNRLQFKAPAGLTGLVDIELKSALNDVLLAKELNFGSVVAGTRKATLIVGGFDHNSRKLSKKMKARINKWLDKNSDLSTLTCTGFTSLPRRTTDVELSSNRGITACNFSLKKRSELDTSISQGIEDPRPGSNVRRVRLVLTP